MSNNLVKHGQLEDILSYLWEKVKGRYDKSIKEAVYNKATQKIDLTFADGSKGEVDLTDLASKTLDNKFLGKNIFNDLHLTTYDIDSDTSNNDLPLNGRPGGSYKKTGRRDFTSDNLTGGYVRSLLIRMVNNATLEQENKVSVWVVEKGDGDKASDKIVEHLHDKKNFKIIAHKTMPKCIEIPIKKRYDKPTYFIYAIENSDRMACNSGSNDNNIYIEDLIEVTPENIASASTDHVGIHALVGIKDDTTIDIREELSKLTSSSIKKVNTKLPDENGEVTLVAADIKLTGVDKNIEQALDEKINAADLRTSSTGAPDANKVPQLDATGKLDKSMIPEIAINRVLEATNKAAAIALIEVGDVNGTSADKLQVGDVVVLTQENNAIYMYNGKAVAGEDQFATGFVELSLGNGTVKKVNTVGPGADGNVTLYADKISIDNGNVTTVKAELEKKIETINTNISAVGKNITLKTSTDQDAGNEKIKFGLGDQAEFLVIDCMTATEIQQIKDIFQ